MNTQRATRIGTAALALATAGAVSWAITGSVADAAAGTASHTLKFTSVQSGEKDFSNDHFVESDKDVRKKALIGFDVTNGVYHPKTKKFSITDVTSLRGGTISFHGTGNGATGTFSGTVDGGTGTFEGVHGTVTGKSEGSKDQNEKLVIVYHR